MRAAGHLRSGELRRLAEARRANCATPGSNGIAFDSVRRTGGECVAIFRPRLVQNVRQSVHLRYAWDGNAISEVYEIRAINL